MADDILTFSTVTDIQPPAGSFILLFLGHFNCLYLQRSFFSMIFSIDDLDINNIEKQFPY